jgi:small subunit ribosomal protein S16
MRAILSYKGVMYKDHLLRGLAKKALTEQQVEEKFAKWLAEKEGKITAKKGNLLSKADETEKKRLALENEAKEKRAAKVAAKVAAAAEAEAAKSAAPAVVAEAPAEEAPSATEEAPKE